MADRDTPFGLQEVEPSPVEEKDEYFASPPIKSGHTLGLSHSIPWYLSRIQKYSSYAFTAFGIAHIANTSIIPLVTRSLPASESYLLLTRPYYQGFPAEPLLVIAPVWAHVLSGVGLRIYRWNKNVKRYGDPERKGVLSSRFLPAVSSISKLGFQFTPLLFGHAFINRVVPQNFLGGSSNVNLSYVSHAFAKHAVVSYLGFTALVSIGCFHITWGWAKWLGYTPDQSTATGGERALAKKRRWYVVNGIAITTTVLWLAGSFGVIARGGCCRRLDWSPL